MSGPAASQLGLHPSPIGTLEELRREQIGSQHVGSCAPPSKGVRGCAAYEKCIFRLTKNGGFRDHGPKNIAFFHETHEGHRRQEYMACFTFHQVLYERARAGQRDREDGLNGEIIRVVAQEGQMYRPKLRVNKNEGKLGLPPLWVREDSPRPVPAFPRPGEMVGNEYDAYLVGEEKRRMLDDPDMQTGPPLSASDMEPELEVLHPALEEMLAQPAIGPAPVAAPVTKKST